jgi:hypothetical protein
MYKIVRYYKEKLESPFVDGPIRVEYKVNEKTVAKIGKLFVYDDIQSCLDIMPTYADPRVNPILYQLWEVETGNVERIEYVAETRDEIFNFWRGYWVPRVYTSPHTYVTDYIILRTKVI